MKNAVGFFFIFKLVFQLGSFLHFYFIRFLIDGIENCFGNFLLPSFADDHWEVFVQILIIVRQLDAFGVLLVERSNVECIGSINLATRRYQRWGILLQVHQLPVDALEERMLFDLVRTAKMTNNNIKECVQTTTNRQFNTHLFPLHPSRLSTSRANSPSSKVLSSTVKTSGSSTFWRKEETKRQINDIQKQFNDS